MRLALVTNNSFINMDGKQNQIIKSSMYDIKCLKMNIFVSLILRNLIEKLKINLRAFL